MQKLQSYLPNREATQYLGVSLASLHNWKITEHRHPVNNYRLYRKTDLAQLLRKAEKSKN